MEAVYRPSPAGVAVHAWITKPDTKFNDKGVYKVDLAVNPDDPGIADFLNDLEATAQQAFEDRTSKMPKGKAKGYRVFVPVKDEEDADGNPTGRKIIQFRQNAVLRVEGKDVERAIALFDANDEAIRDEGFRVFSGAKLRVMFKPRDIEISSSKMAGIRLDFLKVQVIDPGERGGGSSTGGFGETDGYTHSNDEGGGDAGDDADNVPF